MPSWILISSASRKFPDRAHSSNHWFFYDATWYIYKYLHIRPKTSRGLRRGYRDSLLETTRKVTTIASQDVPSWAQWTWQQKHCLSVCIWFQDRANLRPLSPCPRSPHPHRSLYCYFSISVQCFSRVVPQYFCQTIHQVIWPSPGTLLWPYIYVYRHIHRDVYSWILWSRVSCTFTYCAHSSYPCSFPCIFLLRCEIYI